jgi:hypothetical protein
MQLFADERNSLFERDPLVSLQTAHIPKECGPEPLPVPTFQDVAL